MFHWTSAGCSSFQFQAAWWNPQGKGAASCCHHGSREKAVATVCFHVTATNAKSVSFSLFWSMSLSAHYCNHSPKENMKKKKRKKDCSQICLQWMLADTFLFVFHLDYLEPQVLIFFNEAQISLNQHREEALPSVRESTERNLLSKRRCQWLFLW